MRRFFGVMAVLLATSNLAQGQATSEAGPTVEQLLLKANSRRALAAQEIDQNPSRVEGNVARIMDVLDSLFQNQLQVQFWAHYQEVEQTLQTVSLPGNTWEIAWKQYKALVDMSDLNALVEDFIRRAEAATETQREDLFENIDTQLNKTLTAELEQAQDTIRASFQEILAHYFPTWDVPQLLAPSLPTPSNVQNVQEEGSAVSLPRGTTSFLVAAIVKRVLTRVGIKMGGKVLERLIGGPLIIIGIGYDLWEASQVKASLEHELRTRFLAAYKEAVSPTMMWTQPVEADEPPTRQQFEQQISEHLHGWSEHCREEVVQMLDAAHVFVLSPNVQDYIAEQTQEGRNTREIVEDMILVGEVFGQRVIVRAPFGDLLMMIVHAPDKQELAFLARELDTWLLEEYVQHGQAVLDAANRLGVPVFVDVVRAGIKLNWYEVHTVFEQYPRDLSDLARRGLVLALVEQTAVSGVARTTLENVARHEELFRVVASLMTPETDKLFRLFSRPSVVEVVDRAYQKNAEVASAFLSQWPVQTWERYRDTARFSALMAVADYRLAEQKQTAPDFAGEIGERDDLTPVFIDVGLCGMRLWDAYAGPAVGQYQRKMAEKAIDLYKKGYPCEDLQTWTGFRGAQVVESLPAGLGRIIHGAVGSLRMVMVGIVALVLGILVFFILILRKLIRRTMQREPLPGKIVESSPVPSPPFPQSLPPPRNRRLTNVECSLRTPNCDDRYDRRKDVHAYRFNLGGVLSQQVSLGRRDSECQKLVNRGRATGLLGYVGENRQYRAPANGRKGQGHGSRCSDWGTTCYVKRSRRCCGVNWLWHGSAYERQKTYESEHGSK